MEGSGLHETGVRPEGFTAFGLNLLSPVWRSRRAGGQAVSVVVSQGPWQCREMRGGGKA